MVIVFIIIVPFIIIASKGGIKNWQNKIMKPYIDEYNKLAQKLNAPPPEVPEHDGYKSWPVLRYSNGNANITIKPATHYELNIEKDFLYRDPYGKTSQVNRSIAAIGNRKSYVKRQANQVTEVRMKMPNSLQGTGILITPETIAGKIFSYGEIKTNNLQMDKTFHITGSNPSQVNAFLTPEICDALLKFRQIHGKFQLNENEMIWIKIGYKTHDIPPVVDGLLEVSKVLWK